MIVINGEELDDGVDEADAGDSRDLDMTADDDWSDWQGAHPIEYYESMPTPTTTKELRDVLCDTIAAVRDKSMTTDAAEAISNASGKIIASLRVELEYRRMRGEVPKLAFIEAHDSDA